MAQLLLFGACERVIINQEDNVISMISLLNEITVNVPFPQDQPLPENTAIPMRWYFLSLWRVAENEIGTPFSQRVTFESPTGKPLISAELTFEGRHQIHRGVTQMTAFPIAEFGTCLGHLEYRQTDAADWKEIAVYPLDVRRGPTINIRRQ